MEAVAALREAGIAAGVSLSPILPLINDSQDSIDAVVQKASEAKAQWVWHNVLFLKPCARAVFLPFVEREFPHMIHRYRARYNCSDFLTGPYLEVVKARVDRARQRFEMQEKRSQPAMPKPPQLELPFECSTGQSTCK